MYTPRSSREILRDLLARMVARTDLNDINEGSVLFGLMSTVAEQIAETDVRLAQIREQFTLEGSSGTDLDDRVDELGFSRLPPTRATGSVFLTRASSAQGLSVPAGSLVSSLNSGVQYKTQGVNSFAIGETEISVSIEALILGSAGDALRGQINTLVDMPAEVTGVRQETAITGADEETDDQLKQRASRFLNSLARCQPSALEYATLSFSSTTNERASSVKILESLEKLGEVDVLIDDGTGLANRITTKAGETISFTARNAGVLLFNVESPIVSNIIVQRTRNAIITYLEEGTDFFISRGRGQIQVTQEAGINVGDVITVRSYSVYTGLVAELQAYLDGDGSVTSGWRGVGTELRVLPAPVQTVDLNVQVTLENGLNFESTKNAVQASVNAYINQLDAGDVLFLARLIDVALVDGVMNVVVRRPSGADFTDVYPNTSRTVLRAGIVTISTSNTED